MFNVIRSNTEIAITPPRIARLRSNLAQSFITSHATHDQRSKVEVCKGQGNSIMQQKRYNTAKDRYSDFKLGMTSLLKRKWAGVARRPQFAMHSQLPRFLVIYSYNLQQ